MVKSFIILFIPLVIYHVGNFQQNDTTSDDNINEDVMALSRAPNIDANDFP